MKGEVDRVLKTGDSLGGVFEVVAHGVPPGLGTYAQWDERLDALLAAAVMSLQAVKAVEIGAGVAACSCQRFLCSRRDRIRGESRIHRILPESQQRRRRSKAEFPTEKRFAYAATSSRYRLSVVLFSRWISASREPVKAAYERSDVCVVPAAGVAAEAMVALTIARCALEKFGGDSVIETVRNFQGYCEQLKNY